MIHENTVVVTMPGYYAEKTIEKTVRDIPRDVVDRVILSDDASKDRTAEIARTLDIDVHVNETNSGYGGNVKKCLQYGLDAGADVVVLLHPDYQYMPKLVLPMAAMLAGGPYDLCLASRVSGRGALSGGMSLWKYMANWFLTKYMNVCLGRTHTEYHTGYRAYSRRLLEAIPFHELSDDFIFDNQLLIAAVEEVYQTCEITCPTVYDEESSSIKFSKALKYGIACMRISTGAFFRRFRRQP